MKFLQKKMNDGFKSPPNQSTEKSERKEIAFSGRDTITFDFQGQKSWKTLISKLHILTLILLVSALLYNLRWLIPNNKVEKLATHETWKSRNIKKSILTSVPSTNLLNVFQVYQPVTFKPLFNKAPDSLGTVGQLETRKSSSSETCQAKLMEYSFANSYGKPFVGNYTPPSCKFNRVIMNFTATSRGRQYDRLAIMYLGDIEVWRTSTAEPTESGIVFEYIKDMSQYMSLWKSPQKVIFDLGNIVNEIYTGPINTTLSVNFLMVDEVNPPADQIIPISSRKSYMNAPSVFKIPPANATNTAVLPKYVNRAIFTISACGQGDEEFWWQNTLNSTTQTFKDSNVTLYGYSPFREIQLLIDGQLAGVQWPFPVIFTGGVVPGLWRPIVGIDSYDLREQEIDITPWLGILSDGAPHRYEIRVLGIQDDNGNSGKLSEFVGDNWLVTGKIFLWLDSESKTITTGSQPNFQIDDPVIEILSSFTQNTTGTNETLQYVVNVSRTLSISSTINTAKGSSLVRWKQNLKTINYDHFEARGDIQVTKQEIYGTDESTGDVDYQSNYSYGLWCNSSSSINEMGDTALDSKIERSLIRTTKGTSVFPTGIEPFLQDYEDIGLSKNPQITRVDTTQNGTAKYFSSHSTNNSLSFGETQQVFNFLGSCNNSKMCELYFRNVTAINNTLTSDLERIGGK